MTARTFICSSCGNVWSVEWGTRRPATCPACGSENLHRWGCACGYGRGRWPGRRHHGHRGHAQWDEVREWRVRW